MPDSQLARLYEQSNESIRPLVAIHFNKDGTLEKVGSGSAVFVSEDRVLSNVHVAPTITNSKYFVLLKSGEFVLADKFMQMASSTGGIHRGDIAMLSVAMPKGTNITPIKPFEGKAEDYLGKTVFGFGFPHGINRTQVVSRGPLSSLDKTILYTKESTNRGFLFREQALFNGAAYGFPVKSGQSGGGILTLDGKLLGIIAKGNPKEGYGPKPDQVRDFIESGLNTYWEPPKPNKIDLEIAKRLKKLSEDGILD